MAYKFPRRIPKSSQSQNIRDTNDGFFPAVEEMGKLNEHNIADNIKGELNPFTDMSNDIAWRTMSGRQAIPVDAADFRLGQAGSTGPEPVTRVQRVTANRAWTDIFGSNSSVPTAQWIYRQFISEEGGLYRIVVGGQLIDPREDPNDPTMVNASTIPTTTLPAFLMGYQRYGYVKTGIKLNGTVIPESVCGDQDEFYSNTNMEVGFSGKALGFQMDVTVPLGPGIHTIGLVAQSLSIKNQKMWNDMWYPENRTGPAAHFEIINCEIFIIEMAR